METIDEAVAAMDALLDQAVDTDDPRGFFTCVYRAVTVRVRDGIRAREFDDNERMERFDVAFARLYLDAVKGFRSGGPVADSWRVTFEAADASLAPLQHLFAGMNAHINLDLGVAAATAQRGGELAELRDDFERLNDVLSAMVDRMQAALALSSPWAALADRLAGSLDELLSGWSIAYARGRAWDFAVQLAASGGQETRLVAEKDRRVAALGSRILRPRFAEGHAPYDVRSVAQALLEPPRPVP